MWCARCLNDSRRKGNDGENQGKSPTKQGQVKIQEKKKKNFGKHVRRLKHAQSMAN